MESKQTYALVGVLVLIAAFVWWGSSKDMVGDVTTDINQQEAANTSPVTGAKKPAATTKVPTSVNPTVVPEKPVPTVVTAKSLAGSTFKLTTYNGTPVSSETKFTLSFTENNFSFNLCNTLSSSYYVDNGTLKANNIVSTAMYCSSPSNVMRIESDMSLMLNSGAARIYKSGSTLIVSHGSGITAAFEGF